MNNSTRPATMEAACRDHKQLIRAGSQETRERFFVRGKGPGKTSSGGLPRKQDKSIKTMNQEDIKKLQDWRFRCYQASIRFQEFADKLIKKYEKV